MQILIATGSFPYLPGEQFIESEIGHWGEGENVDIMLLPAVSAGAPRWFPETIDMRPAGPQSLRGKLLAASRAIIHPLFRREIRYLMKRRKLDAAHCVLALKSVAAVLLAKADFVRRLAGVPRIDLAYSYWNNEAAYALCLLKREGRIGRVISRAHRFDLYEEPRRRGYMPVKRQFVNDFDYVHAISDDAAIYLRDVYGFPGDKLQVSRLGVSIPERPAQASRDGVVRMISVSFCAAVKRIDKIVEAVHHMCSADPALVVEWVHIGDGDLKPALEEKARHMLAALPNARFRFAGQLGNGEVLDYLRDNPVDIFINSSASEGVPVSIMEAMAFGIPAIAPDVGGVSELVNEKTGVLLDAEMRPQDVDAAIRKLTSAHAVDYREGARAFVTERYSASRNYASFVADATALAAQAASSQ